MASRHLTPSAACQRHARHVTACKPVTCPCQLSHGMHQRRQGCQKSGAGNQVNGCGAVCVTTDDPNIPKVTTHARPHPRKECDLVIKRMLGRNYKSRASRMHIIWRQPNSCKQFVRQVLHCVVYWHSHAGHGEHAHWRGFAAHPPNSRPGKPPLCSLLPVGTPTGNASRPADWLQTQPTGCLLVSRGAHAGCLGENKDANMAVVRSGSDHGVLTCHDAPLTVVCEEATAGAEGLCSSHMLNSCAHTRQPQRHHDKHLTSPSHTNRTRHHLGQIRLFSRKQPLDHGLVRDCLQ
jgi:hypothetical protein